MDPNDPDNKRQSGIEYGSGRVKPPFSKLEFDPRDEETTWNISLDDLLDMEQPFDDDDLDMNNLDVDNDYGDTITLEDIERELDKLDETIN